MVRVKKDLTGSIFGRLKVVEQTEDYVRPDGRREARWKCICSCENKTIVYAMGANLQSGHTQSCGCLQKERVSNALIKDGRGRDRIYYVWHSMIDRCSNESSPHYKNYGGRGIRVCEEWLDYTKFKIWAYNSGYDANAQNKTCTLERIDVDGDYCPENCCWTNMKEQSNNKRNNVLLTYNNKTMTISQWADVLGIKWETLWARVHNLKWSDEKAITTPVRNKKNKQTEVNDNVACEQI